MLERWAVASCVVVAASSLTYPLDVCRKRLVADTALGAARQYRGLADCVRQTAAKEGGWRRGAGGGAAAGFASLLREGTGRCRGKQTRGGRGAVVGVHVRCTGNVAEWMPWRCHPFALVRACRLTAHPAALLSPLPIAAGLRGFYRFYGYDMLLRLGGGVLLVMYDELKAHFRGPHGEEEVEGSEAGLAGGSRGREGAG